MNQTHDRTFLSGVQTFRDADDKNLAALWYRGPNTSLNHYAPANFWNPPRHFTLAHIRDEPTWTHPPGAAKWSDHM